MILSHNGGDKITLLPYQVHPFDGGADTHSWGRCTDFNLMLRKGKAQGSIRSLHMSTGDQQVVSFECEKKDDFPNTTLLLFCGDGTADVSLNGEKVHIVSFEAVLLQDAVGKQVSVVSTDNAVLLIAEVQSI